MKKLLNRRLSYPCILAAMLTGGMLCLQNNAFAQQTTRKADTAMASPATATSQAVFSEPVIVEAEPYGGMPNFYRFVYQRLAFDNLSSPQRTIAAFVIEKDGSLTHIKVIKSNMSKEMGAQIVRALYMAPKWKPGTQNGQPVRVQFTVPITNY